MPTEDTQAYAESEYLHNPAKTRYADFPVAFGETTLKEIDTDGRIREDYGDLDELAKSLDICGLIQPLAVEALSPGSTFKYKLLAGGRRYFTMLSKGIHVVPIRIYPNELTPEQRRQIELHENLVRKNFSWQERIRMEKELHEAHVRKFGERINKHSDDGWTKQMTAALVGITPSAITDNLKLAEAVERHPELAEAKTMQDAKAMLKRLQQKTRNAKLAAGVEQLRRETPEDRLKEQLINSYVVGDAFEHMAKLPSESIDYIELDPPYGIDYQDQRKSAASLVDFKDVAVEDTLAFHLRLLTECQRLLKPTGWLTLWHAMRWYEALWCLADDLGFQVNRIPIVWVKSLKAGPTLDPSRRIGNAFEPCLYMAKTNNAVLNTQGTINVLPYPGVPVNTRIHSTEKPIALLQHIITTFVAPDSNILVPFAGSGNTLLAAANAKCKCIGYDLDGSYRNGYVVRVQNGNYGAY
jgi:DNA modification methylase